MNNEQKHASNGVKNFLIFLIILAALLSAWFFYQKSKSFPLPEGETKIIEDEHNINGQNMDTNIQDASFEVLPDALDTPSASGVQDVQNTSSMTNTSNRQILETGGTRHTIPLDEILSGGPGKDGIPSIDNPKFVTVEDAVFLKDDSVGLGLVLGGEQRFYPYQILVWHEIVNDRTGEKLALVTYCPLCATGVVFDPEVNGEVMEFGVSGRLWQSNLLMYNRAEDSEKESLWSQVLGEAVVGELSTTKLKVIPSDTVKFGDWKKKYPNTKVLSQFETGAERAYGHDPYGNYYTDESVSFGASFDDDRLHPKAIVFGVELNGKFKAYAKDALKEGETNDDFAGKTINIKVDEIGGVRMSIDGQPFSYIGGFWFSWLAVHPETELYK